MPRLNIEIGYTLGSPAKYRWLADRLPSILRDQFQLDTVVQIMPQPMITFSAPPFYDKDLYLITNNVIDRSAIRRVAEMNGEWYLHLFITSFHKNHFLGVMYDLPPDPRQRQGCAVFENEIFTLANQNLADAQRIVLRTSLHEIGHCLNLIHHEDRTIMAQTSYLMNDPRWIQNIQWVYAPSDIQYVTQHPDYSRPGGSTTNTGGTEDTAPPTSLKKLSISFQDFNDKRSFKFRSGEPISLIVKLSNKTNGHIQLPLPLHMHGENVRIWIKRPDGSVTRLMKNIRGCGSIADRVTIDKGQYRLLPVNLYSDRIGYLFQLVGQYGIKIGIRSVDGKWHLSRFSNIQVTKGNYSKRNSRDTHSITRFVELGGNPTPGEKKKYLSIAGLKKHELSRSLYWNISYYEKEEVFDLDLTPTLQKKKASNLKQTYQALLRIERSSIRRGKILLNLKKLESIISNRSSKRSPKQQKDINAYKNYSRHLIKSRT